MPRTAAAKATKKAPVIPMPMLHVGVDWAKVDLLEGQQLYAKLKAEFERAGQILNARATMANDKEWLCFMAGREGCCPPKILRTGLPRSTDFSSKDPRTGLLRPARLCSEVCYLRYQQQLIDERKQRELGKL